MRTYRILLAALNLALLITAVPIHAEAQTLTSDSTLRLDYIFAGNNKEQYIALDECSMSPGWYGRRINMDSLSLRGAGQITLRDVEKGTVIYRTSFSTLFQEWQGTPEAQATRRSFENVFLLPMPRKEAEVEVKLFGFHGDVTACMKHRIRPDDILIRQTGTERFRPDTVMLHRGGDPHTAIDVAILPEGYTEEEMPKFLRDAQKAVHAILSHSPFRERRDCFNFMAVKLPSKESGVSVPGQGEWKRTAIGSHFNTFYSDRYLTTRRLRQTHDALSGLPYEHLVILANTKTYGGGGIYNSYTLTTAGHEAFEPVVVHEFGHSFAGLADEYVEGGVADMYDIHIEPWEQNITTKVDFASKWEDMMPRKGKKKADAPGLIEGAGYQEKGVFRAYHDCRMRTNSAREFCPICQRALNRLIDFYTTDDNAMKRTKTIQ